MTQLLFFSHLLLGLGLRLWVGLGQEVGRLVGVAAEFRGVRLFARGFRVRVLFLLLLLAGQLVSTLDLLLLALFVAAPLFVVIVDRLPVLIQPGLPLLRLLNLLRRRLILRSFFGVRFDVGSGEDFLERRRQQVNNRTDSCGRGGGRVGGVRAEGLGLCVSKQGVGS